MFAYCGNNPVVRSDPRGDFYVPGVSESDILHSEATHTYGGKRGYCAPPEYTSPWCERLYNYIYNDDPSKVLDAEYFSFYKGQLVVRGEFPLNRSASFGIMFLDKDETRIETVQHEWGHFVQLGTMGLSNYLLSVAIPSVMSDPYDPYYYSNPWERTADFFGGVNRSGGYKEGSLAWGFSQYVIGPLSVPLYYILEK